MQRQGKRANPRLPVWGLALVLLASGLASSHLRVLAQQNEPTSKEASGPVMAVEASSITIFDVESGTTLVLKTSDDLRSRIATGSQVTAWYSIRNGAPVLDRIEPSAQAPGRQGTLNQGEIKKIIVFPDSNFPNAEPVYAAIGQYLHQQMRWTVASRWMAESIRKRVEKEEASTLAAMDSSTGNFDMARYLKGQENRIPRIAALARVDAVLETNVLQVDAPVSRMIARWDGVEEPVAGRARMMIGRVAIAPHKASVPAATLELKLWDKSGNLAWSNRHGFAVLEVVEGFKGSVRQRPLSEVAWDTERMQKWLAATFASLIAGSEARRIRPVH